MAENDRPDDLPPGLIAAIRSTDDEIPGERAALQKVMAWMGVATGRVVHAGPAPVLAVDQFTWTVASSKTEPIATTTPAS